MGVDCIHANIDKCLDVHSLAQLTSFFTSHFHQIFSAARGEPFAKYVIRRRLGLAKADFIRLFFGETDLAGLREASKVTCTGNEGVLEALLSCVEPSEPDFNIVLP